MSDASTRTELVCDVLQRIAAECERQDKLGYDDKHDDAHLNMELLNAPWGAKARIDSALMNQSPKWADSKLIEAAALIVRELTRQSRRSDSDFECAFNGEW